MPTFNLKIISENKSIQAEADSFESALEIFEQNPLKTYVRWQRRVALHDG
jgi:hypothetical protein